MVAKHIKHPLACSNNLCLLVRGLKCLDSCGTHEPVSDIAESNHRGRRMTRLGTRVSFGVAQCFKRGWIENSVARRTDETQG